MYIQRQLSSQLKKLAPLYPILSVSGPRQSGKTTLVREVFPDYAYVNLERLDDRLAAEEDPRRFLERYEDRGLIIDEAQKVPALFSYLQVLVDERGIMGQFVLTGSQNFLLLEQVSQSLAGRVALHTLLPFSRQELATNADLSLDESLFKGGYPVLYDRGVAPLDYYPAYIQTYVERDVRSLRNIGDLSAFQRFLRVCAGRVGQLLDLSSLGNDLGINYKTVRAWISVLEASYIAFLLYPHHENFAKRLIKSPKLYFYDTGLLCSLLGLESADQLATHYLRGAIFENWVIAEIVKQHVNAGHRPDLYFWRDNIGNELDLLYERGGGGRWSRSRRARRWGRTSLRVCATIISWRRPCRWSRITIWSMVGRSVRNAPTGSSWDGGMLGTWRQRSVETLPYEALLHYGFASDGYLTNNVLPTTSVSASSVFNL